MKKNDLDKYQREIWEEDRWDRIVGAIFLNLCFGAVLYGFAYSKMVVGVVVMSVLLVFSITALVNAIFGKWEDRLIR